MNTRSLARGTPRRAALVALALVAFLGCGTALAGPDPSSFREFDIGDGRVTFDVTEAPFGQVVAEKIQPKTRVNLVVSSLAAAEKVTLRVVDLYWVDALDTMTERIHGALVRKSLNLLKVEKPPLVTLDSTNEDIREVIKLITAGAGGSEAVSVVVSPEVTGRVTVSFRNVPWRSALRDVVETAGKYTIVESDYGVLKVVPTTSLELGSDTYQFRYLRPPPPYKGVVKTGASGGSSTSTSTSGGGGSGGSASVGADIVESDVFVPSDDPSKIESFFPIVAALRSIVEPEGGRVTYIPGSNSVLYTGTAPKMERVRKLCEQLDVEPPQVFVDMNIIATTNTDALDLGFKSDSGFLMGFTGAGVTHRLPFAASGSGWTDLLTGTVFPPPSASSFSYGTLSFTETSMFFQALKQDGCSKVVQAPKILALDNQEATIFVGESIRYARSTAASNQNGGLTFSVEEDDNSPVNVGFQLLVIPHVIPGENKIMLLVIPQQRALNGTTSPIPGFDRFTVSGQTIDLPRVRSSTMVTTMLLRDKETAVIGGLLEDRDTSQRDKLPILGDLPVLGALFSGQSSSKVRQNIVITITPRILRGSDAANLTIDDELSGRSDKMRAEWSTLGTPGTPAPAAPVPAAPAAPTPAPVPVAR